MTGGGQTSGHFPERSGRRASAEIARALGSAVGGVEHAFLAMIRRRETVPARALAGLADLDTLEAAVLEAKNAPAGGRPADAAFLPGGQEMDGPLRRAIADALPEGTTFGFNCGTGRMHWMHVIGSGDTSNPVLAREVLNTALTSLNRPALDS